MQVEQKINFHNRFDIEVNGELVGYAENIILDQMWTRLCAGSTYFANIHFGTGAGTPTAARTSLFTHLGTKAAVDVEKIRALPVSAVKRKITINPEEHIGAVLTEVGIAFGATSTNLVTHAMIKDAEGNPLTITKGATDVIIIYATVYITLILPTGVTLAPVTYTQLNVNLLINWLLNNASAPAGVIRLYDAATMGQLLGSSATMTWTADAPNKKRIGNPVRFDIYTGNGNIEMIAMDLVFSMNLPAPSIFNGQAYTSVPVGTYDGNILIFRLPSMHIKDETLSIKVNGVVNTDYTIEHPFALANITDTAINTGAKYYDVWLNYDGTIFMLGIGSPPNIVAMYEVIVGDIVTPNSYGNGYTVAFTHYVEKTAIMYSVTGATIYSTYAPKGGLSVTPVSRAVSPGMGTLFGFKVSKDGSTAIVIAVATPYVRMYNCIADGTLEEIAAPVIAAVGWVIAISDDGKTVVIDTSVFDKIDNSWVKRPALPIALTPNSDKECVLRDNGNTLYISAIESPGIFKFTWDGSNWTYHNLGIVQANCYGIDVDDAQETLVIGTYGTKAYRLFKLVNAVWTEVLDTYTWPVPFYGYVCKLSGDGKKLIVASSSNSVTPSLILQHIHQDYTDVRFNSLTVGDVITADYTVNGIHKTDQYVVDVGLTLQFAEGV